MAPKVTPIVIGICGKAGSGKDTIARHIADNYKDIYIHHFADTLKQVCALAFGLDIGCFYSQERKEEVIPYWGVSPRKIAQFMGTEVFREALKELLPKQDTGFWVKRLAGAIRGELFDEMGDLYTYGPEDVIVIPDVRFQDEVDFVLENRGVILTVKRSGYEGNVGIDNHASETTKLEIPYHRHYEVNNSQSLGELYKTVDDLIASLQINNQITLVPKYI